MARLGSWIETFPEGIYVRPADAWVDPSKPKPRALITHGHGDHARGGHGSVLATPETLAIMALRYGEQQGRPVAYGESVRVGDVGVSFVPAGHVLGSAQIVLEHSGEKIVVSGDYKRREDPTCHPFVPVPCDVFITEATFGLPVFRHPDTGGEIDRLLHRLHSDESRCVLVGAYALGKAQRVIAELRRRGHEEPIYIHGALERMCALYEDHGIAYLKLLGVVLERVRVDPEADLVWTYLTRADLDAADLMPGDADDLIDLVRTAREADVATIIRQQRDGRFKVSLRSRGGHDVAAAAARFGGGGHRLAAGFTSSKGLVATVESLKEALGAELPPTP